MGLRGVYWPTYVIIVRLGRLLILELGCEILYAQSELRLFYGTDSSLFYGELTTNSTPRTVWC